jgi:1-acyl-sn-glycerol-3-phosphate acyltransferase
VKRPAPASSRIIPAHKHGWPCRAVHALIRSKLRGGVHAVRAQGLDALRVALAADRSSFLFLANHSSWWDFFLAHWINVTVPVDGYGMTEHFNMRKFGFFRRIGAYGVDRSDPLAVRASLDYTIELLSTPGRGVWLFPQGKIVCNDVRPLGFEPGLRVLLKRAGRLRVVPTAIRYEFWQDERPEVLVRLGAPVWVEREEANSVLEIWEHNLTTELDALRVDALSQDASRFETVFHGKGSTHDRYDRVRSAVTGDRA